MQGWIKLHRQTLNSPIFNNPHLLKMWMWCLLKASHKEHDLMVGLKEVKLKEGQFVTGRNKGSSELNVNPSTWYKHIKSLEKMEMVSVESNNKFTIVTVENWSIYQDSEREKEQQKNNKITTKEQQNNTNKNVKNGKNEKTIVETPTKFNKESIEYKLSERLYRNILLNDDKTKKPNLDNWAVHIDRLIRIDNRSIGDIEDVIDFVAEDEFWKTNILSTSKLRKQFPQVYLKAKRTNVSKFPPQNTNNWKVDAT